MQMFTDFMTRTEKESEMTDLIDNISNAMDGATFTYRGLTVKRQPGQSRKDAKAIVLDDDGQPIDNIDMLAHRTATLVKEFDSMRQEVYGGQ